MRVWNFQKWGVTQNGEVVFEMGGGESLNPSANYGLKVCPTSLRHCELKGKIVKAIYFILLQL